VLLKEDNDWVRKCIEYEVEGPRRSVGQKRIWREVVPKGCEESKFNREDAMDRSRWRKQIKDEC